MEAPRSESLYASITSAEAKGVEAFKPEDFRPCKGTVLVILAPVIDRTTGGLHLPDAAQVKPNYGRVVTVPEVRSFEGDNETGYFAEQPDPLCPVKPGDWIIFRPSSGTEVSFAGRKDLLLISYTDDLTSEILGVFDKPPSIE